jgi:hypothetical protein
VSLAKLEILCMRQNKTENFAGIYAAASTAADMLKSFTIMCQSQGSSVSTCNPQRLFLSFYVKNRYIKEFRLSRVLESTQ